MKFNLLAFATLLFLSITSLAQVGINNTNPQSQLDISASNVATPSNMDGILIPRVDAFPATSPTAAQHGMMVFLNNDVGANPRGFYYWDNTIPAWVGLTVPDRGWDLTGNTGTDANVNFLGTTDAQDLSFRTNNVKKLALSQKGQLEVFNTGNSILIGEGAGENEDLNGRSNMFIGTNSGYNTTSGYSNVAIGQESLYSNTTGYSNVAIGQESLNNNTTGGDNIAIGPQAMNTNTTGNGNIAMGYAALQQSNADGNIALGYESLTSNTSGYSNIAHGSLTLTANTTGSGNIALAANALSSNVTGENNVALGVEALGNNTAGHYNFAVGYRALFNNHGTANIAIGQNSMVNNNNADHNIALGFETMVENTDGANNIALGNQALYNNITGNSNIAIGENAGLNLDTGGNNIFIGRRTAFNLENGTNNIIIGANVNASSVATSDELNIGNTIYGNLANDNVGIGVPNPTEKLEVDGKINATTINFSNVPVYNNQSAAQSDPNLNVGDVYRIGGNLKIKF